MKKGTKEQDQEPEIIYRGIKIKKYPRVYIRVSQREAKKFIDMRLDHGVSEREVIEAMSSPCECSERDKMQIVSKSKGAMLVPRNMIKNRERWEKP